MEDKGRRVQFPKLLALIDPDENPFKLLAAKQNQMGMLAAKTSAELFFPGAIIPMPAAETPQPILNSRGQPIVDTRSDIRANIQKEWDW